MSKYIKQDDVFELVRKGVLISNSNFESVCKHIGSLPTIEVSEDAISREYLLSKVYDMDNDNLVVDLKDIEDAPSVVPTTEQSSEVGEWELYEDTDGLYGICSVCGTDADFSHYGEKYDYCPNCGAKMKGAEE